MNRKHKTANAGGWRSRSNWLPLGFLAIAGFFLFSEHQAHLLGALPLLLLLLCPLLHVFGHGVHGVQGEPPSTHGERKS